MEVVGSSLEVRDEGPLPRGAIEESSPEIGIGLEWALDEDAAVLGCLVTFGATFEQDGPFAFFAQFRLVYDCDMSEQPLADDDIAQFVAWNAVFNAWPFWREYLANTLSRARLPRVVVPVLPVPMPDTGSVHK